MRTKLIPFSLVFLLLSCSKSKKESPEFYFRFKSNGVQKEYLVTGSYFYNERICLFVGSLDSTSNNTIQINLESTIKIKADTTYTEIQALPAPTYPKFYISLSDNYPAYNYRSWVTAPPGTYIYPCTVNIEELDASHIKGTVSGKVSNEAQTAFITITDGEFNVKR